MYSLLLFYISLIGVVSSLPLADIICPDSNAAAFCQQAAKKAAKAEKSNSHTVSSHGRSFSRRERAGPEDPSCKKLKAEYDHVCFTPPPPQALLETKEFCDAFVETCIETLKSNLYTNIENLLPDYSIYCKKQRERFRYVCPDPVRFHSYADDAIDFCSRYKERCPSEELPSEPVQFRDRTAGHIYTREIQTVCKKNRRFFRNYCTDLDVLKIPKYQLPCAMYKYHCIDVYQKVIYGG